jgi:hypothetical protein
MNAIVSGRSGRALLLDGESLKSFELDDPSTIVPRRRSELPYLFGEAADLRILENTTIESVEHELRMDCHFTWALDLALISLDAELEDDIRTDALEDLEQLLDESTTMRRLESVLYAKPLPEDADLKGALDLCDRQALSNVFGFLRRLEERQPSITSVSHAWEIIPTITFGGQENREVFEHIAVKEGLFHSLATLDPAASVSTFLLEAGPNPSVQRLPNHQEVLQVWTAHFSGSRETRNVVEEDPSLGEEHVFVKTGRAKVLKAQDQYSPIPTALTPSNPPEVFISYSHEDEKLLERLEVHLNVLKRQKIVTLWHDRRISPGKDWEREIDKHLNTAQIILLLVSADFIASDYCYGVEFKRAMERNELEAARVIPVILSPCNWRDTPSGKLNALPQGAKPVVEWASIDDALVSVTDGIKEAVKTLRPSIPSITTTIKITLNESRDSFDQNGLERRLHVYVGVDLGEITISVRRGDIVIEGDNEELVRIVNALRDSKFQREIFRPTSLKSITYVQDQQVHSIAIGTPTLFEIVTEVMRKFPAVKYALLLAVIATAVTVVAGFSSDYQIAVFGPLAMFVLMFGLVRFSCLVIDSTSSTRPLVLTLTWTFVILTSVISLCIFTGFFFDWPRPLEAYLHPLPTPSATPLPSPIVGPSPTPLITKPTIEITEVPSKGAGPDRVETIAGKVGGVKKNECKVVIFVHTDRWYVQPYFAASHTSINEENTWRTDTHLGSRYAALLVKNSYEPPSTFGKLPDVGGEVLAIATINAR